MERRPDDASCQPVYEYVPHSQSKCRLVMTPWMLMDRLKECQSEAAALLGELEQSGASHERRCGVWVNPAAERAERIHFTVTQMLHILWRTGLWTNDPVVEQFDADGTPFQVLRAPFTDGKPNGRPVTLSTPNWKRELLGLSPAPRFSSGEPRYVVPPLALTTKTSNPEANARSLREAEADEESLSASVPRAA